MIKPAGFDSWSAPLKGAFLKGYKCAEAGGSAAFDCPYWDKRKESGRLTWSRSFIRAWHDGFSHYSYPFPPDQKDAK